MKKQYLKNSKILNIFKISHFSSDKNENISDIHTVLYEQTKSIDSIRKKRILPRNNFNRIYINNPHRIIRANEVSTSKSMKSIYLRKNLTS